MKKFELLKIALVAAVIYPAIPSTLSGAEKSSKKKKPSIPYPSSLLGFRTKYLPPKTAAPTNSSETGSVYLASQAPFITRQQAHPSQSLVTTQPIAIMPPTQHFTLGTPPKEPLSSGSPLAHQSPVLPPLLRKSSSHLLTQLTAVSNLFDRTENVDDYDTESSNVLTKQENNRRIFERIVRETPQDKRFDKQDK